MQQAGRATVTLAEGVEALYAGRIDKARELLQEAAKGLDRPAVALSYLSLAHRAALDTDLAREAIARAKEEDDACFEAYAAEAVLLLTRKRLESALEAWRNASKRAPYDLEGHFLSLLLFCLFSETLAGGREDADHVRLDFRITPPVRAAVMILDGNAGQAAPVPLASEGPVGTLAEALLLFRKGERETAAGLIRALSGALEAPLCSGSLEALSRSA